MKRGAAVCDAAVRGFAEVREKEREGEERKGRERGEERRGRGRRGRGRRGRRWRGEIECQCHESCINGSPSMSGRA